MELSTHLYQVSYITFLVQTLSFKTSKKRRKSNLVFNPFQFLPILFLFISSRSTTFDSSNHFFTLLLFITFIFLSLRDVLRHLGVWGGYGNKVVVVSFVSVFQLLVLFVF